VRAGRRAAQAREALAEARGGGRGAPRENGAAHGAPPASSVRQRSGQAAETSARQPDEKATPEQRELARRPGPVPPFARGSVPAGACGAARQVSQECVSLGLCAGSPAAVATRRVRAVPVLFSCL
jgi:hypothetical protein